MGLNDLSSEGSAYFIDPAGVHIEAFADAVAQAQREGIPVCILAITSALVAFFDWCEAHDRQFALPGGSRIMDTGGSKGMQRQVSRNGILQSCWKYLKVAGYYCVNEYGMTEMASQFYDNVLYNRFRQSNEPRYKIGPPWVRTLVVDPETLQEVPPGQVGILRHFDLANSGSVMAIQTDDLGYTVGDGFEITGRVPGSEARGCALMLEELVGRSRENRKRRYVGRNACYVLRDKKEEVSGSRHETRSTHHVSRSTLYVVTFYVLSSHRATLSPAQLSSLIDHLLSARERHLVHRPLRDILTSIDAVIARFLDPHSEERHEAEARLPAETGLS